MTTTTGVALESITLFTVLFNMKEVLYCEYTPANFKNKELFCRDQDFLFCLNDLIDPASDDLYDRRFSQLNILFLY